MFPKAIWVELLERETNRNPGNVNVVYYKQLKWRIKQKPNLKTIWSFARPLDLTRTIVYWNMEKYADVIVDNELIESDIPKISIDEESKGETKEKVEQELTLQLVKGQGKKARSSCLWTHHTTFFYALICLTYICLCPLTTYFTDGKWQILCNPPDVSHRLLIVAAFILVFQFWLY